MFVNWFVKGGMTMKIGYSFWGFLGDIKIGKNDEPLSTPDGNAFYSWCIINGLLKDKNEVIRIMPNRDIYGYKMFGDMLFKSWCAYERATAYKGMIDPYKHKNIDWRFVKEEDIFTLWDEVGLYECDAIIHEWRMYINLRNDYASREVNDDWQPDYFIQDLLIKYCKFYNIKLIIFDLDYKLEENDFSSIKHKLNGNAYVIELGEKWKWDIFEHNAYHVEIPFDFDCIDTFEVLPDELVRHNLVYVGNRYERDWCIDKYIPTDEEGIIVYGNWKESGRDSEQRWPGIKFGDRLQVEDMRSVYGSSACTIMLAKEEYLKYSFVTARLIESIFYGCVPLFIKEYGEKCIKKYTGDYARLLTVSSKEQVVEKYKMFSSYYLRKEVIEYLRDRLKFMDVKNFLTKIYKIAGKE